MKKKKVMQTFGGQIRCIMGNVKVTFAKNYACKRGFVVKFARLKGLVWTAESEQFLLVGSEIW